MIVAIDTSSSVTVLGVGDAEPADAQRVTARLEGGRRHAEGIDVLFAEHIAPVCADIRAIAVGIGPGPYSGLRVGIAFGIGLGRARGVPVVGACSLDVRAWQIAGRAREDGACEFVVATDARRSESYWARYRLDPENAESGDVAATRVSGPMVGSELPAVPTYRDIEIDAGLMAARIAALIDSGTVPQEVDTELVPHGTDASGYLLGPGPLFRPTPVYLRQPDVTISGAHR